MIKIKVIDLDVFYNFVVCNFSTWSHLLSKTYVRISQTLKLKVRIVQTKFDGEMFKMKTIDLNEFYNFIVDEFFIWNRLLSENHLPCQNRYISDFVVTELKMVPLAKDV
jgi:hypothetical protein